MRIAFLLALPLSLLAAACGFSPLYAPSAGGGAPVIGPVIVDEVPGKSGYELKSELDKLFDVERGSGAAHRLSIKISEAVAGVGFRVDESASRSDLTLNATYTLYDVGGARVLTGRAASVASYDIASSAYAEITAQDDARTRAAQELAEKIRSQIALRLASAKAP